ncbi:MAG TPA: caspase family protein, partial [Gemmatimonadaceae bacterium]|nr:caspase family protein [Gemmatimonadaceae bacterium]
MRAKAIVIGSGLLKGTYPRCTADLKSADNDAQAMAAFAEKRGFDLVGPGGTKAPFLSAQAKKNDIMGAVTNAATELEGGDILLFFYSGHGATLPPTVGSSFKQQRETWSLLDGRLWDFEWNNL